MSSSSPDQQLTIQWRKPIGSGYSGPTVAEGRVFVTDRLVEPAQQERVHCFDAKTGKPLWTHSYDCVYEKVGYTAGPRASVTIDDGRAYSLGSMGHLFCLDAASGKVLWSKNLNEHYKIRMPIWGIAASPLVDDDLVIVQIGGEHACLVAFDKKSGEEKWKALDDNASYSSPIIIDQAGRREMVCWTGDSVSGLNPQTGEVYWQYPFKPTKMVINIATPVLEKDRLFFTSFYDGSLMLGLKSDELGVDEIWRRSGRDETAHRRLALDHQHAVPAKATTSTASTATANFAAWMPRRATASGRASSPRPNLAGARSTWSATASKIWMFNERGELIIARLSPKGYDEISRAKLIEPTRVQLPQRGGVCWTHPAFADQHVFARNDEEIVCASLKRGAN